jgi:type IV pilus assembly protein PilA
MKQIQKGFTLIELMIVVAIIGILAAVAIPAYQDYVVKAKLAKVSSTIDSIKTAVTLYYQENGSFPDGTATATFVAGAPATLGGAANLWSSLGLSAVTLPPEVSLLTYTGAAAGAQPNFGLSLVFARIRASTIDGQAVVVSPVTGNTVLANGTITVNASGIAGGMTSMPTYYACSTNLDVIAKKYFNNGGSNCP